VVVRQHGLGARLVALHDGVRGSSFTWSGVTAPLTSASPRPRTASITSRSRRPLTGSTVNSTPAAKASTMRCTTTVMVTSALSARASR
jgi:hypothetical protein